MPSTSKELDALLRLGGGSAAREREILHRLIAGHHTRLADENKAKLAALANLLLRRLEREADAAPQPRAPTMDALCGALSSIAALVKGPVLNAMKERIAAATVKWQTKAAAAVRRAAAARCAHREERRAAKAEGRAAAPRKKPRVAHVAIDVSALVLCRLAARMYTVSDYKHPVLTPAAALMREVLSQRAHELAAPPPTPTTRTALRREIYLLALTLEYCGGATRYCAEAYTALVALLRALLKPPARGAAAGHPLAVRRPASTASAPPPPPPPTRRRRRRCRRSRCRSRRSAPTTPTAAAAFRRRPRGGGTRC